MKIPLELVKRFLREFIPEAAEIFSLLRTAKPGDGLSPKLRQILVNLKVQNWAPLYQNPQNQIKLKLLFLMTPEEINELNAELITKSQEEQEQWAIETIESMLEDDSDEFDDEEAAQKEFDSLNDDEKTERIKQSQISIGCLMPIMFNYLAIMVHRKSMFQLVAEAINGDDESFLKAIQIDKTVLTAIPHFVERNLQAARDGDFAFQRRLNTYRNKPITVSRPQYPTLWLLFAAVEEMNLLEDFEVDKDSFFNLCEEVGAYGFSNGVEDVQSFSRRLRDYKKDQALLSASLTILPSVKDANSSN
ncbi:MAG: hypothetical protein KJ958_00235 [Gammaproteobacteria bacterium]|nr:hypothetical protein [Gammaproteobacteria bacterium]MBU1977575.1 hypothetical protein [Gammaproteobacteria bacterium]